jgi:hypothetical protein
MEQHAKTANTITVIARFSMFPLLNLTSYILALPNDNSRTPLFVLWTIYHPPYILSTQFCTILVVRSNLHSIAPQGNEEAPPGVSRAQGLSAAR